MKNRVRAITALGMGFLAVGLCVALSYEILGVDLGARYVAALKAMPPAYVVANVFWALGALVLIIPPVLTGFELLVVLEVFLTISGVLAFWQPEEFALKIVSRVGMSLLVIGYLKHRKLVVGISFPWSLLSPSFYIQSWQTGDNRALAVGIELLGIGYALASMECLTIGSAYLVRSAWVTYRQSREEIFLAWTGLNVAYTATGVLILLARYWHGSGVSG